MHSNRLKKVCKLVTLLLSFGVIHAATTVGIDGSADLTGLPGSIVGWGFNVSSDTGGFPLFTGSQFSPDPNTAGVYQDYLAASFFFGAGGSTVTNTFNPFTQGGAGEFDISPTATLGDFLAGTLQLFWDEYTVSPMDPSFDPQADLLQSGVSQILSVSVSVDTPMAPISSDAPEPSTYWLCLAGAALLAVGKRDARWSARLAAAALMVLAIFHGVARAQQGTLPALNSTEQDALKILRFNNGVESVVGPCHPGSNPTLVAGCCGSPGVTGCLTPLGTPSATNPASGFYCTSPSSNILRKDPYDTLSGGGHPIYCNLAPPSCDASVTSSIQLLAPGPNPTPQNVTFFFTSDIHFYRDSDWAPENQIRHVTYLNSPGALTWTYSQDPITGPSGVVIGGDIGLDASATDVGAFRLLYENNVGASLRIPMFFGLGNHETVTETEAAGAHRMFDYVTNRMNCGGINRDPITGNYSWDWGRLHLVMLNTWADDIGGKYNQNTQPHGLTWLANDLAASVGVTGRPVILFQHYGFTNFSFEPPQDEIWWTTQDAANFLNTIKNYNIVGIFNGHTHIPSVQRLDATDWANTNPVPRDSAGNEKDIDVFTNGTGGEYGSGDFIAVRYQDGMTPDSAPYLDVESLHWDNTAGITKGVKANLNGQGSDYYGGRSACRKRIDTRFNNLGSLVNLTYSVTPPGLVQVHIANSRRLTLTGPLALQVMPGNTTLLNTDFTDSCGVQGANTSVPTHSYALLSDAQISGLNNGSADIDLTFNTIPSPLNIALVGLTPLQGAAPVATSSNSVTSSSIDVIISGSPASPPASTQVVPLSTQSFYVFGQPGATFTVSYQYTGVTGQGPQNWVTSVSPNGVFDVTGRTLVSFTIDPNQVVPLNSNTPGVTFTVSSPGDPFGVAATVLVTVHFKAAVTISVTESPATWLGLNYSGTTAARITAVLGYTPFKNDLGDNQTPSGQVIMADATLDANGNIVATTPITYQFVNSTAGSCRFGPAAFSPPNDTVVFGDTGDTGIPTTYEGYCPSFVNPTTPFQWGNLPLGLHHFVVQYSGDNAFAPSTSQVFDYLVVLAPNVMTVTSGTGQSTLTGTGFAQPLAAKLTISNQSPQPGIPVTFTAPGSGPSGSFPGNAQSVTVRTDSQGVATAPPLTANGVAGSFVVTATLPIVSPFLSQSFNLTNLPLSSLPLLAATITAKSGALNGRVWTVNVTNTQGAATAVAISSIGFTQVAGAACTPAVQTAVPIALGNLADGASASAPVTVNFGSCASTARFTVAIGVASNSGAYQWTTSIGNQFP